MDAQTLIVALVVAAALLFVGRKWYRTFETARRPQDGGCAGGCGCSKD